MPDSKPATLAEALAELQTRLPHIGKESVAIVPGGRQHKYASLAAVSHHLLPIMGDLGLSFTARPTLSGNGGLVLMYALTHVSGDALEGEYPLPQGAPQTTGSAITYARRYILCCLTGAVADDDDDGAAAVAQQPAAKPKSRSKAMTAAQQREHDALRDGAAQGAVNGASRGPVPPGEDVWDGQPPGEFNAAKVAPGNAGEPGSIGGKQLKDIHTQLTTLGIREREAQLARIEQVIKGPLDGPHKAEDGTARTSRNLSRAEAEDVYRDLAEAIKAKRLAERRAEAPA